LEQQPLFDQFNRGNFLGGPWLTKDNGDISWIRLYNDVVGVRPPVFVCPSDGKSEPCCQVDSKGVVVGESHWFNGGTCAATGNYAMCFGTNGPPGTAYSDVKYGNTGAFVYIQAFGTRQFPDGLSNTLFVGEGIETDTFDGALVWNLGYRYSTFRTTRNPINTPPGAGIVSSLYTGRLNAAFQSYHPGGAQFAFGDGHVAMVREEIDQTTYDALATRALGDVPATSNY
jgi:prepilin-type processing-associated H-X9-DG protein